MSIEPQDSLHDLYLKTIDVGPRRQAFLCTVLIVAEHVGPGLVMEAIERIACGSSERIENDASQASSFSFPDREEGHRFRDSGKRFF